MELDEGVVLVEHGGVPGFGDEAHEAVFGGGGVGAGDDTEALRDAEMMTVNAERATTQCREVDDGSAGFGADTRKLFKPRTDLVGAVFGEEVEGEGTVARGDALQCLFELRSFLFGEGNDVDGSLDVGDGGVADGFPVAGAGVEGAFEVAHHLMRDGRLSARGE